jgi:hypothetical protein
MAEKTQAEQMAMNAVKVRTHNPLDSEWEHDEVRHKDEIRRADRSCFAPSFYLNRLLTKHTDMNTYVMRRLILWLAYCFHGVQIQPWNQGLVVEDWPRKREVGRLGSLLRA